MQYTYHAAKSSSDSPNPPEKMLPFLRNTNLSAEDYDKLQTRLYVESVDLTEKFGNIINTLFQSLKEREIPIMDIIGVLKAFGTFTPLYKGENKPLLREELSSLNPDNADINEIKLVFLDYCSFFNFRLLAHLVKALGTPSDSKQLAQYEKEFNEYAKRRVFECPPAIGKPTNISHANMIIKLDDSYKECTLNQIKLLEGRFCTILNITDLKLCHTKPGCLQLVFQLPWFVQEQVFPLSKEQEEKLVELGVLIFTCGEYSFRPIVRWLFQSILSFIICTCTYFHFQLVSNPSGTGGYQKKNTIP